MREPRVVALDPGVRTFITFFSENSCGKIVVLDVNEAYTSKTVSWAGEIVDIGSSKIIKSADGQQMDRDMNGARGIFLRALWEMHHNWCLCSTF